MAAVRESLLRVCRVGISQPWFPGRFLLAEAVAGVLTKDSGHYNGRLGHYLCDFDFHDLMQRQVWFGLYDHAELRVLRTLLGPGSTFFDVGANIGCYSFHASEMVGVNGHVYAFEPVPHNVQVIQTNIERNHIGNITLVPKAVGEADGSLTLYHAEDSIANTGHASIVPTPRKTQQMEVPVIRLDTFVEQEHIGHVDVVKLDVEGAEFEVLRGMRSLLSGARAPFMICEFNEYLLDRRSLASSAIFSFLGEFGYRFSLITTAGLRPVTAALHIEGVMNVLCSPQRP